MSLWKWKEVQEVSRFLKNLSPSSVVLALTSGALYSATFPKTNLSFLAWVALVPLLLVDTQIRKQSFFLGWLCGFCANLLIFFWLVPTFNQAKISLWTTVLCWLLLSAILALYFGAFKSAYDFLAATWYRPIAAAAVWVSLEHVRTLVLTGFPWALFGHTQAYNRPIIQIASITGAEGVSFLLVLVNCSLVDLFRAQGENIRALRAASIAGLILASGNFFFGRYVLSHSEIRNPVSFRVALLQGNIDQYQKWDDAYEAGIIERYSQLAREAAAVHPDLIVWPESSVPGWYPTEKKYLDWVNGLAAESKVPHFVGSVTSRFGSDYNAAFLVMPDGTIAGEYAKQILVPFGEYVPFGGFLKRVVPYIGQLGIFEAGRSTRIFNVGDVGLMPNICYEAMFPELIRKGVNKGADVIVNVTNDGWFLKTAAPEQHYVSNIFRAVENGRPVVRCANTGISAVIDATGFEILRTPLLMTGMFSADLKIARTRRQTFFGEHGLWFVSLCLLLSMGVFLPAAIRPLLTPRPLVKP